MNRFAFIKAEKVNHKIRILCRVMRVSRSGYYDWLKKVPSNRARENGKLDDLILQTHEASRGIYGYRRTCFSIRQDGYLTSKNRVQRRMKALKIQAKQPRAWKKTTDSSHGNRVAENVLNRTFLQDEKDRAWVTDVTYIRTAEGWLYLATVLELWPRRIVGWAMSKKNDTDLAINALKMALWSRNPKRGWIHHSDRGSPYTSDRYAKLLKATHAVISMSKRGDCYDNAVAESFFSRLKQEMIYLKTTFKTRGKARLEVLK